MIVSSIPGPLTGVVSLTRRYYRLEGDRLVRIPSGSPTERLTIREVERRFPGLTSYGQDFLDCLVGLSHHGGAATQRAGP